MSSKWLIQADTSEQLAFEDESISSSSLHANLLSRARLLLAELTAFQSYLQFQKKGDDVNIRQFLSSVQSEAKGLERIVSGEELIAEDSSREEQIKRRHILRSSNLPFYETVWQVAGRCKGVVALGKRNRRELSAGCEDQSVSSGHNHLPGTQAALASSTKNAKQKKDVNAADVVADDGETWIKVSTVTERRLLFEMAKEGWEGYDDECAEDQTKSGCQSVVLSGASHQQSHRLELVRLAEYMRKAASAVRVRYRHPKIHFILPRIYEGRLSEIDAVIEELRKTGAKVQCAAELQHSLNEQIPVFDLSNLNSRFSRMLPQTYPPLSPILNIDFTILLALVSDISHLRSENLPAASDGKYHFAITHQIRSEETKLLLHSDIFPLLVGRQLHCTWHAARRMREIVQTMGTAAEKARADVLLGEDVYSGLPEAGLCTRLKDFSDHDVPTNLHLPIHVVDFDADVMLAEDRSRSAKGIMSEVCKGLSEINKSVFLYGWSQNIVTISSNRVVAKEIERRVSQMLDEGDYKEKEDGTNDVPGPVIWVCATARSLIGKERGEKRGIKA